MQDHLETIVQQNFERWVNDEGQYVVPQPAIDELQDQIASRIDADDEPRMRLMNLKIKYLMGRRQ